MAAVQHCCIRLLLRLRIMLLLATARPVAALAVIRHLRAHAPTDRYALASHAHVLMQLGQQDEAIASLQALTQGPAQGAQSAPHWFNLGFALAEAGRVDEAVLAFQSALAQDDWLDRAWYGLGLALMRQGHYAQAVPALERNTALQPLSPHAWYRLAQSWLALGEPDKARAVVARLRSFEPRVAEQLEQENPALRPRSAQAATHPRLMAGGAPSSPASHQQNVRHVAH